MLVPWYLMASFAYYHRDEPILSDGLFDHLCKDLLLHWDTITHRHRTAVDQASLSAGSCLLRENQFPLRARMAAELLMNP